MIAIGTPVSRHFDQRTVDTIAYATAEAAALGHRAIYLRTGHKGRPAPITQARNEIAQRALHADAEWLLFIDDDATAAPGSLTRLLSREQPLVSALAFKRKRPITPACGIDDGIHSGYAPPNEAVMRWLLTHRAMIQDRATVLPETPERSLLPVDVCGTHYLLIHRSVLEMTAQPWFRRTTAPDSPSSGSDWWFCRQAAKAGFQTYVDLSVVAGHLTGEWEISSIDFLPWQFYIKWQAQFEEE